MAALRCVVAALQASAVVAHRRQLEQRFVPAIADAVAAAVAAVAAVAVTAVGCVAEGRCMAVDIPCTVVAGGISGPC